MNILLFFCLFVLLLNIELIYFRIADRYKIIDHPNHRSSHSQVTIRGGGIIFALGFLLCPFYIGYAYGYFLVGLSLISIVSFIDDIKPISKRIRIFFHLLAVALLFFQVSGYGLPLYVIALGFILVVGMINAVNFMDGINGITGGFGLITLLTFYFINEFRVSFTSESYLLVPIVALIVFNIFNFRTKAKCFAGDVGSVSIAFIILFFLLQLVFKTSNLSYLLVLLVYGLDTVTTIVFRIIRKENIFKAHRSHFYQFLVNQKKMPHLLVAGLYIFAQGVVNLIVINISAQSIVSLLLIVSASILTFILIRLAIEGSDRILNV